MHLHFIVYSRSFSHLASQSQILFMVRWSRQFYGGLSNSTRRLHMSPLSGTLTLATQREEEHPRRGALLGPPSLLLSVSLTAVAKGQRKLQTNYLELKHKVSQRVRTRGRGGAAGE